MSDNETDDPSDIISLDAFRARRAKPKEQETSSRVWRFNEEAEVVEIIDGEWIFTFDLDAIELRAKWLNQVARTIRRKRERAAQLAAWDALASGQVPILGMFARSVRMVSRHTPGAVARSLEEFGVPSHVALAVAKYWTAGAPSPSYKTGRSAELSTDEAQGIIAKYYELLQSKGITPAAWTRGTGK